MVTKREESGCLPQSVALSSNGPGFAAFQLDATVGALETGLGGQRLIGGEELQCFPSRVALLRHSAAHERECSSGHGEPQRAAVHLRSLRLRARFSLAGADINQSRRRTGT
jgi:hypothetical protein